MGARAPGALPLDPPLTTALTTNLTLTLDHCPNSNVYGLTRLTQPDNTLFLYKLATPLQLFILTRPTRLRDTSLQIAGQLKNDRFLVILFGNPIPTFDL